MAGRRPRGPGALALVGAACCVVAGAASVAMGFVYLTASEFQPYHGDALGAEWSSLDEGTQALLRALIHVAGGGWLATGLALLALVAVPWRRGERWPRVVAPLVGLAAWLPTTWATIEVTARTDASPPWRASVAVVLLLVVGAVAGLAGTRRGGRTA